MIKKTGYFVIGVTTLLLFLPIHLTNSFAQSETDRCRPGDHPIHNPHPHICPGSSSIEINIKNSKNLLVNTTLPNNNTLIVFKPSVVPNVNVTFQLPALQKPVVVDDGVFPFIQISSNNTIPSNKTLSKYVNETIHIYNTTGPKLENISITNNTNLGKYNAIKFEYESIEEGVPVKVIELNTKINDTIYSFDYRAGQHDFEKFIPIVKKIIDSVEIKKK